MKITNKTAPALVRVVDDSEVDSEYRHQPYAFSCLFHDWPYFADDEEYFHAHDYAYIPVGTMGLVVAHAQPFPNVTMNYAKVLFPKMTNSNFWLGDTYPAGAYWICGEFLELVEDDDF